MAETKEISKIIEDQTNTIKTGNKYAEALNRYFKLVILFLAAVVLVLGYYLVIAPKWQIKSDKEASLLSLQNEVDKLKADSDFLSQYSSKIIEFTPDEERKLNLSLPSEFDLSSTIVQLTRLASANNFIVENIQASEATENGLNDNNIKRVDIEMTVSGIGGNDYGSFGKFIEALESSLMVFDVKAISFTPEEAGYKLELSTYYYPNK